MSNFIIILIITAIISILITIGVYKLFKRKPIIKYIPSVLSFFCTGYLMYLARHTHTNDFRGLGYFVLAIITFSFFVSGMITCIVIDIRRRMSDQDDN